MAKALLQALAERPLLCDGAIGTMLIEAGLGPGEPVASWNLLHPERVLAVQRGYALAGSDCLTTNTFGATRLELGRHSLARSTPDANRRGVEIARQALAETGRSGWVLGGIGPSGRLLKPLGEVEPEELFAAYAEQARALVEAGADAIILETFGALDELALAIRAAREAGAPSVLASMAFNLLRDGRSFATAMGVTPAQAARFAREQGADAAGMNCGQGMAMAQAARVVAAFRAATTLPLIAQPNAGKPELREGKTVYRESPAEMAAGVASVLEAGARIVGACCGSTPEHIRHMRAEIDRYLRATGPAA